MGQRTDEGMYRNELKVRLTDISVLHRPTSNLSDNKYIYDDSKNIEIKQT